jgi:excisionase family DNA binding protein
VVADDNRAGATVQEPPPTFLTPKDVMRELQISHSLCYRLLRNETLPSVRVGGVYRIPRKDFERAFGNDLQEARK